MTNPVLVFHRVSPFRYDLTGVRTGSVRDQLMRSSLLAHGLIDDKIIARDRPLLILGAGAAGMNAAMTAANLGVPVTVLELRPQPFAALQQASWRRVDPTEYDWPQPHWRHGSFPIAPGAIPLMQQQGTGTALVATWMTAWQDWLTYLNGQGHRGRIDLHFSCDAWHFVAGMKDTAGGVTVPGPWPDGSAHKSFCAVLSCIGFGREQTADNRLPQGWSGYSGPAFWTDDDGISSGARLPPRVSSVVISGGGDGALQDVQRVLTMGYFGRELFEKIQTEARAVNPRLDIAPPSLCAAILAAEDEGRRAYAWHGPAQPPVKAMKKWHETIADAVAVLMKGWATTDKAALAKRVLRPEMFTTGLQVTWLTREPHPSYAYALNRFLVLVLAGLADTDAKAGKRFSRRYGYEIDSIVPSSPTHVCTSAANCQGVDHQVVLNPVGGAGSTITVTANMIIIRHGTEPKPMLGGAPVREQMTPFDLPQ